LIRLCDSAADARTNRHTRTRTCVRAHTHTQSSPHTPHTDSRAQCGSLHTCHLSLQRLCRCNAMRCDAMRCLTGISTLPRGRVQCTTSSVEHTQCNGRRSAQVAALRRDDQPCDEPWLAPLCPLVGPRPLRSRHARDDALGLPRVVRPQSMPRRRAGH
jgi:hypothetical protein